MKYTPAGVIERYAPNQLGRHSSAGRAWAERAERDVTGDQPAAARRNPVEIEDFYAADKCA
jgi:hypothetical protein